MYFEIPYVYIELNSESLEIVFPVLFGLIFISLMYLGIKMNRRNYSESGNINDSQLPLYLFRAHVARFIAYTEHTFDEIKDKYIEYLKKFAFIVALEQKFELNQVQYLINNNVNVEQTIRAGKNEAHKKRLLILFFLFNISVKTTGIKDIDRLYLDKLYIDLGISQSVYLKIRSVYIKDHQKRVKDHFKKISSSGYEIQKAYEILNLKEGANFKEVKDAYRKLAKTYHPDKYKPHDIKSLKFAEKKFYEISSSYKLISEFLKK